MPGPLLPQADSTTAAKAVRRVFKKISQEVDVEKYGLSGLIAAIEKALGGQEESSLTSEDQEVLVEFLGSESTAEFLLVAEDVPAISVERGRTVANWFDMFMRAVREGAEKETVWRLGRRLGHEVINAWTDQEIRS